MAENLPEPKSRKESYLAKAAGMDVTVPEAPESREEQYLAAIAEGGGGGGGSYTAGEGIDITSNTISVDTTTIQEKLTAGTGIDITDNTISATGGGGDTVYSDKTTSSGNTGGAVYIGNLNSSQEEQPDPTTTDNHWKYFWALPYYNNKVPSANSINILGNSDGSNSKTDFIVMGNEATAYDSQAVAIGGYARADGQSVGIGYTAQAGNWSGKYGMVAIGSNASACEAEYSIHIGGNTGNSYGVRNVNSKASIAIGKHSRVGLGASGFKNSIALGSYAEATRQGELNIGLVTGETTGGYNDTAYRVIGGVHDAVDAHDAVTLGQLNGRVLQNAGAPTTSTVGTVGQLLEDTTNGKLYQCTDATNPYVWTEVGGGGGGVTVVQTTGTSTTDVMSQDATTKLIYPDVSNTTNMAIGQNSGTGTGSGNWGNTVIGYGGGIYGIYDTVKSIVIGEGWVTSGNHCLAIFGAIEPDTPSNTLYDNIAIGGTIRGDIHGSIALGAYSSVTHSGELNVGTPLGVSGYNQTRYRIITGVHDGIDNHSAATVAQGNTLSTSAPTTSTEGVLGQLWTDTTNMHTYQCTAIDTTDPDNPSYTWTQRW